MVNRLSDLEIRNSLANLQGWSYEGGKLNSEFKFADFTEAFAFMTQVASIAEHLNHHPEWRNVYNRVSISLCTHDIGGISTKDFELATQINSLKK